MPLLVSQAASPAEWAQVRALIEEYAGALNVDLAFQDITHELEHLPAHYGPPAGAFLLVADQSAPHEFLGGVGVRRFADAVAEVKRLYVRQAGRGRGIGRLLANGVINRAADLGYTRLVLDTLPTMHEARALYLSLGFRPIEPYRFNPIEGTTFLELDLRNYPGIS